MITIVRAVSGTPPSSSSRGKTPSTQCLGQDPLQDQQRQLAGRNDGEQNRGQHPPRGRSRNVSRVEKAASNPTVVSAARRPQVDRGGLTEDELSQALGDVGHVSNIHFEVLKPLPQEVIPNVRCADVGFDARLTGALNGSERPPDLCLSGGFRELLHRMPVEIATRKVHAGIVSGGGRGEGSAPPGSRARRKRLQSVIAQRRRLEMLLPTEAWSVA